MRRPGSFSRALLGALLDGADSCDAAENCTWGDSGLAAAERQISVIGYRYCYLTISAMGVSGSLLLLLVLRHACFRSAGVYGYLRCLMLSDCVALTMTGATMLAESWQPTARCAGQLLVARSLLDARWRVLFVPLNNALFGFSIGITLLMTYDRYVAVRSPRELWRQRMPPRRCSGRPLRCVAVLLISLMLHAPQLLGYAVVRHCPAALADADFYELINKDSGSLNWLWCSYQWVLQLLVRWLPTALVLFCNVSIIVAIARRDRRLRAADGAVFRLALEDLSERAASSSQARSTRLASMATVAPPPPAAENCCGAVRQQRQRRHDAEHRLEFLLAAMAVSCLISNCLQSAVIIMDMVYKENESSNFRYQLFRAIGNNVEALNFSLDFVFAIAFVKQIRQVFMCYMKRLGTAICWVAMVPQGAVANDETTNRL